MKAKNLPSKAFLTWFAFVLCVLLFPRITQAQHREYAQVIVDQNHTIDQENAVDGDLSTRALVRASSGDLFGFGAYTGHLELAFNQNIAAHTTTYIKIDADENILTALLGGSLGNLIADVTGHLLIGNQEFRVQAFSGTTPVLTVNSQVDGDFAQERARIVVNANNEYFIALTPNQSYNRIKLTNRLGSVIGFGNTKELGVYGAYVSTSPDPCSPAAYTSYSGEGLNIDVLNTGDVGVSNPQFVLDSESSNYARMSMGIASVASSIEQTVYFEGTSNATDTYSIRLKLDPSLLTAGIANAIHFIAKNGANEVARTTLAGLLNTDLLTLLQGNFIVDIPFSPGVPADRITIEYGALANVNLTQRLDLYNINRVPALPVVASNSLNVETCIGSAASLVATAMETDLMLNWYASKEAITPIATVASGESFTTPPIFEDTIFYVASVKTGCVEESVRIAVPVKALSNPVSTDITIDGIENSYCENSTVILQPTSTINGSFSWFFDENKTLAITNGLNLSGATYTIDGNGTLTIKGLPSKSEPYTFYVSLTNANGCENPAGDLKEVQLTMVTSSIVPTLSLDENITPDDVIQLHETNGTIHVEGSVGGDAKIGDTINLLINSKNFGGTVGTNFKFSISVPGSDLVDDTDHIIEASIETITGNCVGVAIDTESYTVDESIVSLTKPSVNALNTNDTTPTIKGTADSSDNLTVEVDNVVYTEGDAHLVDNKDNTWTLIIPEVNALMNGIYDVIATVSDGNGNTAVDGTTDELTIDTTTSPIVLTQPTVNVLNASDATPTITGTADSSDNLTVEVDDVVYTEGDAHLVDNKDNTWTLTIPEA
ncbi:Ig-like domain-containing protein, partial [Flavobacteriaceae bacterium F08102]|nr:Ig-like domain-containing protein [Flavobacteriaceae bacterium F08102]